MTAFFLLFLFGCTPSSEPGSEVVSTRFPTATLHPVFSSGDEFANRLSETRSAGTTKESMEEPSPTPRPSPTDSQLSPSTPTPAASPTQTNTENAPFENAIEIPILLYHHISVPEGGQSAQGYENYVPPEQFEAQLAYLDENGYTTIDLYMLYDHVTADAELPPKPILLTFDDGYLDMYENAFPILQRYGFTGTFFMNTDFVEEERADYMTWDMVEEMVEAGMRFETHSSTHADLRGQPSDFLIWQVLDSQELLTYHIGYTPRFIAYPFGQYDENLIEFLEVNDFWGGLTVGGGLQVSSENRFSWPRLYIPPDATIDLFESIITEGLSVIYQPGTGEEETTSLSDLMISVSISTTQGAITMPAVLVYDEELNDDWTIRTSPGVQFDLESDEAAYSGDVSLSYSPGEDYGSFFLQVRPDSAIAYSRDDIVGLAFWLYTGSEPLTTDDLALAVNGSNEFPYWSAIDQSIDPDDYEPTFEDARFALGFNKTVGDSTWVQVVLFFNDLDYDTGFMYITGLNFVNNAEVSRTFLIDELVFILR